DLHRLEGRGERLRETRDHDSDRDEDRLEREPLELLPPRAGRTAIPHDERGRRTRRKEHDAGEARVEEVVTRLAEERERIQRERRVVQRPCSKSESRDADREVRRGKPRDDPPPRRDELAVREEEQRDD